mmetsp:Transcript_12271/g.25509  ORF Transcript_12271/g.25509 Transcript_12271/m.25509 type:complete len:521 (-) Transcript_12271:315-1877(-)|eukprot:CAMPEP_0183291434 /NCGR_PEP_ID=MMETSP0160_2-20130417/861_1 /TAXON_ID=2839 ORGANISM="Odontella Sinensis, Strain Grunow 1884" /NCGR_SAMPLE_ID=MMETSP0160_2 /ASSEMBLY_ACC=CAM_ASM_000250 /LENGTH=520 /DNA_ID=CAMNT_0025452245 /DNA_START=178 /DNA_END=1743 /DNA_ORIENTATION=-
MQRYHELFRLLFVAFSLAVRVTGAASGVVYIDAPTITDSSMTVKWQYSPPNNWSVESYLVCWKYAGTISGTCGSGGLGSSPQTIITSGTAGSYSVTGLPDDATKYKLKVKANIVKNSNSNKKKTKTVGTVKAFTDPSPTAPTDDCPVTGAVGHLYADPTGETTMTITWDFHPDCTDFASPINSMEICWERKGNPLGICSGDDTEDTIENPVFAAGYNIAGLKPCKRYRIKLWGIYDNGKREIGTTTMRTQCPPKMMMNDNSDCAEEGVSLCLPALNNDTTTFERLQNELVDTIFDNITSILEAPPIYLEGIFQNLIKAEVDTAVERSVVYKNLKVGQLSNEIVDQRKRLRPMTGICTRAEEQDPLTKEEIKEVARISYFLRDAVDFINDDLSTAIEEELFSDLVYAAERKIECGVNQLCQRSQSEYIFSVPDPQCLALVPEVSKEEVAGDIADAIEDLYDRFDTSDCHTECQDASLQDILLVQMMEGEVNEEGCPKAGAISNHASSLGMGLLTNLYDKGH